jgi:hypothetical protein
MDLIILFALVPELRLGLRIDVKELNDVMRNQAELGNEKKH